MYTPLETRAGKQEIRLLRLLAGKKTDSINCELVVMPLARCPKFEALSYVWGSEANPRPITLQKRTKLVTQNLESALRHLRYIYRPRTLWADALCINQDDNDEKSHQVQLMADIYSGASQVLVWFGTLDGRDRQAIETISNRESKNRMQWTDVEMMFLLNFFNKSWWTRIWTAQEAVLARRITYHCGDYSLLDSVMYDFASGYVRNTSTQHGNDVTGPWARQTRTDLQLELDTAVNRALHLRRFQERTRREKLPFDEVALEFRNRVAKNPRDKVYGLLGMSRGVNKASVNYSLGPQVVFEITTREVLSYHGNLNVLSQCDNESPNPARSAVEGKATAGLPSWVPDWGKDSIQLGSGLNLVGYRFSFLNAYCASGRLKYVASRDDTLGTLGVPGVLVDRIDRVGERVREKVIHHDAKMILEWRNMAGIDREGNRPYVAGKTMVDSFWRTLLLDIDPLAVLPADARNLAGRMRAGPEIDSMHQGYWYQELLHLGGISSQRPTLKPSKVDVFDDHITKTTTGRRFFISKLGYIGLAPAAARVGDKVCVLAGGKMPFIVRDLERSGQTPRTSTFKTETNCRLIGDAYVHGLMDGEAIAMVDKGNRGLEIFRLH
ncbi:Heterokaryon incompatibility protein 6, OR allele 6 [Colletotrichum chlorophyti]|uniref:Heterokaryon incompatibility protein 6, OR allele 6 n=1 Tax=Colletotrichum chlorophyti TaxID=708187 RepID=A0A1Q8RNZ8_9PEZI|nr:Heterokaryon incompatibility protein 6, OR allele 6 [Colletotrichum chlorophyti]